MGFKTEKTKVINCLKDGSYLHATRVDVKKKNLLKTGEVTPEQVIQIIQRSCGNEFITDRHHALADTEVHIIRTVYQGTCWYIKWYFVEPNTVFISVHP
jgi:hypothetical protein